MICSSLDYQGYCCVSTGEGGKHTREEVGTSGNKGAADRADRAGHRARLPSRLCISRYIASHQAPACFLPALTFTRPSCVIHCHIHCSERASCCTVRDLAPPGEVTSPQTLPFEFSNVEMQYDSYRGLQVRLRFVFLNWALCSLAACAHANTIYCKIFRRLASQRLHCSFAL